MGQAVRLEGCGSTSRWFWTGRDEAERDLLWRAGGPNTPRKVLGPVEGTLTAVCTPAEASLGLSKWRAGRSGTSTGRGAGPAEGAVSVLENPTAPLGGAGPPSPDLGGGGPLDPPRGPQHLGHPRIR